MKELMNIDNNIKTPQHLTLLHICNILATKNRCTNIRSLYNLLNSNGRTMNFGGIHETMKELITSGYIRVRITNVNKGRGSDKYFYYMTDAGYKAIKQADDLYSRCEIKRRKADNPIRPATGKDGKAPLSL